MAALQNAKHELFAQKVAEGMSAARAYEAAGYKTTGHASETAGSRLLSNVEVASRLQELQTKAAEKTGVTLESMIQLGLDIIKDARTAEDFTAASSTYERLAKIAGLWIDRSESKNTNTTRLISDKPMTEDEWLSTHQPAEARPN